MWLIPVLYLFLQLVKCEQDDFDSYKANNPSNPKFINKWLEEYSLVSGNTKPPRMYAKWIKLALNYNCSIRPTDYRYIFSDLEPFKKPRMSMGYIQSAGSAISVYRRKLVKASRDELNGLSVQLPYHIGPAFDLIEEVLDPDIDFNLLSNYFDEPMVVPSDDHKSHSYTDMDSVFERNAKFRERYSAYRANHSLLQVPCSFVATPVKFPVLGLNRFEGFLDIIMPTHKTGLAVMSPERRKFALESPEWSKKITKAIFRGSTTGIKFKELKRKGLPLTVSPRFKLYEMTQFQQKGLLNCSVPLDFGITSYCQFNGDIEDKKLYLKIFPLARHLGYQEQFKFKYQVIVDGNGWPDRVASMLLSGSLVFLATLHEDWVIRQIEDGVHYIKVKPDLSDLVDKLEWAASHDEEAAIIASNGRELALKKFNIEQVQVYNAFLLMEYQNLFPKF